MNLKLLLDKIVALRTTHSVSSAKAIILIIFGCCIIIFFLSDLILKSKPINQPYYLDRKFDKTSSEAKLGETLNWHLKNNLGSLLAEEDTCSLWIKSDTSSKRNFQLDCPVFDLHRQETLENFKLNNLRSQYIRNREFWRNLDSPKNDSLVSFSPFNLKISSAKVEKMSQGILGEEITVKIEFEVIGFSEAYKNLANQLNDKKPPLVVDDSNYLGKKLFNSVIFRSNRYGYYLPVMGLVE